MIGLEGIKRKGTREEELVIKAIEGFSKVKTIKSVNEI